MLPLVDEVIVALGNCDANDRTEDIIRSIDSNKIKIFTRVWDENLFKDAQVLRDETTFALNQCTGDWCIYLQADEVLHERDHSKIKRLCQIHLANKNIEGFLLKYYHFFGDYQHYFSSHAWYPYEIRIVRNHIGVQSFRDAQSFRIGELQKLKVLKTDISVFHYGWVRPPELINRKRREQHQFHHGKDKTTADLQQEFFEFGPLGRLNVYKEKHPEVMHHWIQQLHWQDKLDESKKYRVVNRGKMKHEKLKYRVLSFIENNLLNGAQIFGWRNWKVVSK